MIHIGPKQRSCAVIIALALLSACGGGSDADLSGQPAGCPSDEDVESFLADWRAARPTQPLVSEGTIEDALCAQQKILQRLEPSLGAPVGFKAGLTSVAAQERFGVEDPVRGVLLEGMLLQDGASVPATFGAQPLYEADLLVVVADEAVNDAQSPEEVLSHLSGVIPFIELPDLAVVGGVAALNGPALTAINVAARLGVVGETIAVEHSPAFLQALADMTVRVFDQNGDELATAQGSAVLGHPLNAILWLVESGVRLGAGDYVSVGSIGPLLTPEPGQRISVTYEGLPGNPTVSVAFR